MTYFALRIDLLDNGVSVLHCKMNQLARQRQVIEA